MAQARISIAKKKSKNPSHSKPAMKKKAVVQEDTKAAKKLAKIAKTSPSKKTLQASSVAATLLPLSEPAPKSIITKPAVVPEPLKIKSIGKNNTANGRRRSVRFAIMQRVDYKIGDRSTFNYSSNLSASGLFIRGATKFKVGEQISIKLHLNRKDPPLFIRCIVRRIKEDGDEAGAGLEFIEEQDKAFSRIRQFIEEELIKKIEANLQRSITNTNNLILLATYYFEIGRIDDALSLYRRGIETNPTNQQILERAIGVFIPAVRLRGLHGWQLLVELEKILASAMALGPNSKLKQYQAETIELREQLDRRNREQAQAEAEERKLKQQEYETKLRANIEKEVKNVVEKELALHKRELEHEFAVKQKQAEKELADTYKEIKQERAELEIFATTLKEQETKFKRIQQKLEQRQSRFELEQQEATEKLNKQQAALVDKQKDLHTQAANLKKKTDELVAQEQANVQNLRVQQRELLKQEKEQTQKLEEIGNAEKLDAALKEAKHELSQLKRQVRNLLSEKEDNHKTIQTKQNIIARIEKEFAEQSAAYKDSAKLINELRGSLRQSEKQALIANTTASDLESQVQQLKSELDARVAAQNEAVREASDLAAERSKLKTEAKQLEKATQALVTQREAFLKEGAAQENIRAQNEATAEQLLIMREGLDDARKAIERERQDLVIEQQASTAAQQALSNERQELEDERKELAQERLQIYKQRDYLAQQKIELDKIGVEQNEIVQQFEIEKQQLRLQQSAIDESRSSFSAEQSEYQNQLEQFELARQKLVKEKELAVMEAEQLRCEFEQREQAISAALQNSQRELHAFQNKLDTREQEQAQKAQELAQELVDFEEKQRKFYNEYQLVTDLETKVAILDEQKEHLETELANEHERACAHEQGLLHVSADLELTRIQLIEAREEITRLAALIPTEISDTDIEPLGAEENQEEQTDEAELELIDDAGVIALLTIDGQPAENSAIDEAECKSGNNTKSK